MATLVLVRHSTPAIDPRVPSTAWGLGSEGERAARELADQFVAFRPAAIQTSPERKARETAAIIAARLGAPIGEDDDLAEHRRPATGFLPRCEFESGICRLLRSPDAVFVRFQGELDRARAAAPNSDLLVVSHGTAMSIYVGRAFHIDPYAFWRSLATPMAAIISDEGMRVVAPASASQR